MANPEHVVLVRRGAQVLREWREQHAKVRLDLRWAHLSAADLREADLSGADLTNATLLGANLRGADLTSTDLTNTDLTNADLTDAQVTEEQLEAAKSLEGATMPNGQKYEDWLKSKDRGDEGENNGP